MKTKVVTIRVDPEMTAEFDWIRQETGVSISHLMRESSLAAIREYKESRRLDYAGAVQSQFDVLNCFGR